MFCIERLTSTVSDKLFYNKLSRKNANQRHVVTHPDGTSLAELLDEALYGKRIEESILLNAICGEQRVYIFKL
jgi:hypothetical protein